MNIHRPRIVDSIRLTALILTALSVGDLWAEGSTTLTVTTGIASSIELLLESVPGTATGVGTSTVSTDVGNFAYYGPAPSGFSRSVPEEVTATIGFGVQSYNATSTSCTLSAGLSSSLPSGVSWMLDDTVLSTTPGVVKASQSYGSAVMTWKISVSATASAGATNRTITFTATAN